MTGFSTTSMRNVGMKREDIRNAVKDMLVIGQQYVMESDRDIDLAKTMMMALIHDIVEIDAGDTYAYDTNGQKTQKERERKAADRIFGMLPDDQRDELRALFEEFEAGESAEARFAKVMDNFQPLLLNHSNGGADWKEHKVTKAKVTGRQRSSALGSEEIWKYTEKLIDENVKKGSIIDE